MDNSIIILVVGILVGVVAVLTAGAVIGIVTIRRTRSQVSNLKSHIEGTRESHDEWLRELQSLFSKLEEDVISNKSRSNKIKSELDRYISKTHDKFEAFREEQLEFFQELDRMQIRLSSPNSHYDLDIDALRDFVGVCINNLPRFHSEPRGGFK